MPLRVQLTYDDKEAKITLGKLIKMLPKTAARALRVWILRYVRHVVKTRFLGPGGATDTLKRQTGTAIRSINASPKVKTSTSRVTATAGAKPFYVREHEEGFSGKRNIPAHQRRRTARQRRSFRAKAKAAGVSAKDRAVLQGAKFIQVRAHARQVTVRARHMFRHGLKETTGSLPLHARAAVKELLRTGKIPSAGAIEQLVSSVTNG